MPKINCPECDGEIKIPENVLEGEIFSCPDCGIEYEVIYLNPLKIEKVEEGGEDWGE